MEMPSEEDSSEFAGCPSCLGATRMEPAVSTTNRNFPGRMGNKEGEIYLSSPFTAAASALKGKVADPREYM